MLKTFHRNGLTWLAYILLAFFGFFLNVLGPITPFLKSELNLSYTISSLHFTAFAVGILLVGIGGHRVIQRLGRWYSLWVGAFGMSLSAVILLLGKNPIVTIGAAFLMGLIGSLILVIVPALLSEQHGDQSAIAFSEANVIASLVATAAPLLVGFFAAYAGNWRYALGLIAITPVFLYVSMGKGKTRDTSEPADAPKDDKPLSRQYWIYWAALVLAVSVEFCMIFWSADFLENMAGMLKVDAAQAVSLFFAGMIFGRLLGSRLVQRIPIEKLVAVSTLVAGAGFLIFWKSNLVTIVLTGLFITGLGVASLYPLILSMAIGAAGKNSVQASSRATLASGTAILILPLVLGRLADAVGIGLAYGVVPLLLLGVFLITQFARKTALINKAVIQG
jgi:fucose permease